MEQNTITLKGKDAVKVFDKKLFDVINEENEFIFLDGLDLKVGYFLDVFQMQGYIAETEDECWEIINLLEVTITKLKPYTDSFEVIFFNYGGEYSVCMWKYDGEILKDSGGWIGDFIPGNEDDYDNEEEYENAQNNYVDEITEELKSGFASDELRKSLINDLKETDLTLYNDRK